VQNHELRHLTPDDLDEVCALHNAAHRHDRSPVVVEVEEFSEELDDEHVVFASDTLAAEVDGRLVAYAYTYHLPSEEREERCYVFGKVHPAHRRMGVGTALMQWGIRRATEQLLSSGRALPAYVRVDVSDDITDAHRLFAALGMTPVRYMDELLRPLTDLPPLSTVDGITIAPWPDDRDEEIRAEKNVAFEDHWGSTPTSAHHWEQMVRGYGARPDLSFVAFDGDGRVVGHCLNKRYEADDDLLGRRDGWIDNLGTLPQWRGRGIASALIATSLHAFAAEGLTHASIGVDSENPSGAAQLYRALGFQPNRRSITHELRVR
jgi:mycothiol synthase